MSERFWVSAPDPNVLQNSFPSGFKPFRRELFTEFVHTLLALFYGDTESLIVSFLLEHVDRAAFTDQQIAETLKLPQRQVKSTLETRLIKDFVIEAEYPTGQTINATAGSSGGWFRINPNILIATVFRLTKCEKTLLNKLVETKQSENYTCKRCGRVYDLLRTVSVCHFFCEVCDNSELEPEDNRSLKLKYEGLLSQMNSTLRPLREVLHRCDGMYVPRPIVVRRSLQKEAEELGKREEEHKGDSVRNFLSADHSWTPQAAQTQKKQERQVAQAPEWLKTDQSVSVSAAIDLNQVPQRAENLEDIKLTAARLLKASHSAPDLSTLLLKQNVAKKEEVDEDVTVLVQGQSYSLRDVRSDDNLLERMTDEEYQVYDGLLQQRLKLQGK